MNKINVIRVNDRHNILQKYTIDNVGHGELKAIIFGYDVVTIGSVFVKSFDDYDEAVKYVSEL